MPARLLTVLLLLFCACVRAQAGAPAPGYESAPEQVVAADSEDRHGRGPDRHLVDLLDRYVWIVPTAVGHRISLGVGMFLLLALVLQLAAKMADLEQRTFGRCVAFMAFLFAALLAEISLAPPATLWIVGLCVLDVLGWCLLARALLQASGWAGISMLVCFTLAVLVGVVLLEVAGFLLGGHVLS